MRNKSLVSFIALIVCACGASYQLEAQEAEGRPEGRGLASDSQSRGKLKQLEEQVLANPRENALAIKELSNLYFTAGQYNQFADFLGKLTKDKVQDCSSAAGYYLALCRYHQLRHLEEAQDWQEYFDKGADYREELFRQTRDIALNCPNSPFAIRAQTINWLEHKARNDGEREDSLNKVISLINGYVKQAQVDDIEVIKEAADILSREKETAFSKAAYNLYVNRMIAKEVSIDKLRHSAQEAYNQGNLELSEAIYERYLQLVAGFFSKDKFAAELTVLANEFAAGGSGKNSDPQYAERIFSALEDSSGAEYFSQELQYLRAYNLERMKEYSECAKEYENLASRFSSGNYTDSFGYGKLNYGLVANKAEFKLGLIYTYILGQKERGLPLGRRL